MPIMDYIWHPLIDDWGQAKTVWKKSEEKSPMPVSAPLSSRSVPHASVKNSTSCCDVSTSPLIHISMCYTKTISSNGEEIHTWNPPVPQSEEELNALLKLIKGNPNLPKRPFPATPNFDKKGRTMKERICQVQDYVNEFEYNHTGTRYFSVRKDRGMVKVTDTAKKIMTQALPIQCLEAVFLASYLTVNFNNLDRIPISFKSRVKGVNRHFRHIVMAVRFGKKWGAIGLSRKDTLAYKELKYRSLSDLILDYREAYKLCWHTLEKIYIGFPFSHDPYSSSNINWRILNLNLINRSWEQASEIIDIYGRKIKSLEKHYGRFGKLPDTFVSRCCLHQNDSDADDNEDNKDNDKQSLSQNAGMLSRKSKSKSPKNQAIKVTPSTLSFLKTTQQEISIQNFSTSTCYVVVMFPEEVGFSVKYNDCEDVQWSEGCFAKKHGFSVVPLCINSLQSTILHVSFDDTINESFKVNRYLFIFRCQRNDDDQEGKRRSCKLLQSILLENSNANELPSSPPSCPCGSSQIGNEASESEGDDIPPEPKMSKHHINNTFLAV